jgi:hypothetical protein
MAPEESADRDRFLTLMAHYNVLGNRLRPHLVVDGEVFDADAVLAEMTATQKAMDAILARYPTAA